MKKILLALVIMMASGCASIDSVMSSRGIIKSEVSAMSGIRSVWMTPVLVGGPVIELGLYWDSSQQDNAILNVVYKDAINFDKNKPIEFLIDGESYSFKPAVKNYGQISVEKDSYTKSYNLVSDKNYVVNKGFIYKLANAQSAHFRLWLLNGRYIEKEVEFYQRTMQSFVPYSFNKFYKTKWMENSK